MQTIIALLISVISPEIRNLLIVFVKDLKVKASKTPNPWDDVFVLILCTILDIKD